MLDFLVDSGNIESNVPPPSKKVPPRMESVKRTAELLNLPVHIVREKAKTVDGLSIKAGNRFMINYDIFCDYLNGNNKSNIPKSKISDTY